MVPASAFEQTVTVSDPRFTAIEDQSQNLFLSQEMLVKILALSALSWQFRHSASILYALRSSSLQNAHWILEARTIQTLGFNSPISHFTPGKLKS